jgi:ribose 5-phosphate isomerase B
MKIAIGADHAGFALKEQLRQKLAEEGHQVVDYGTHNTDSTDYPDYATPVAHDVAEGRADRGILVCYTGVGMSISANKVRGVRAALGTNVEEVRLVRGHNDANVLTLGARFTQPEDAEAMVDAFLETQFEGGRHARRVNKITAMEQETKE